MTRITTIVQKQESPALLRGTMSLSTEKRRNERLQNPVFYFQSLDMTEVLHVMRNHCQACGLGSTANQQVELFDRFTNILQTYLFLSIYINAVCKRQHSNFFHEIINQLQVIFHEITLKSTVAQFSQNDIADKTTAISYLIQLSRHLPVLTKMKDTDARIKQISFHSSISLLFDVLLSRISLIISSVERLSFHAPAKRSAQPVSAFACLVGANVLTNASNFVIADSLSSSGLISRNSSARSCIAVIILTILYVSGRKITK